MINTPSVEGALHGHIHIPVQSDADSYDAKKENLSEETMTMSL